MSEHEFTLIIDGDLASEDIVNALFEAGCDDATFSGQAGVGAGDFLREAPTLEEAVMSAILAVESVDGLWVRRVEPDDLVTIPEIAERLGRSPESIRLLANGERGGGTFPPPISHLRTRQRLWRWTDITEWTGQLTIGEKEDARFLAALNGLLEARNSGVDEKLLSVFADRLGARRKAS